MKREFAMIQKELEKRNLPDLLTMHDGTPVTRENWEQRQQELLQCLAENLFGVTPPAPKRVWAERIGEVKFHSFGGKAKSELLDISFDTPGGVFTFPIQLMIPTNAEKPPVILLIAFSDQYPVPEEEIIDNGFALVRFHHHAVQPDDIHPENYFANFTQGLGAKFIGDRQREKTEWGKVGMWAYAASRVMDYLQTRQELDTHHIAVAGHSRLGKTALWCRAQDHRFFAAMGNDTNYGGGGLIRGHIGEDIPAFLQWGSYDFFCEKWKEFVGVPHDQLPFDQHFLMACHAPGLVYLSGATEDTGMDPKSEFFSCCAASAVYKLLGKRGLVCEDRMPEPGQAFIEGEIGFHVRKGTHYFSREDWQHFMNFLKKHMES